MHVVAGASSSVGRKRSRNEDFHVADNALGLFVVVDGMGGHARGDVAAQVVGEAMRTFVAETTHDREKTWPFKFDPDLSYNANRLKAAVGVANAELARRVEEDASLRGMGATVAGLLVDGSHVVISNVGDCRAYLIRGGRIQQVTADHSWVAEQLRSGLIDQAEARRHPLRNIITRAVSGEPLEVDTHEILVQAGDRLLLCSDGLHGLASDDDLLRQIDAHPNDPQSACDSLIEMADARGSPDNVTAILVVVTETEQG